MVVVLGAFAWWPTGLGETASTDGFDAVNGTVVLPSPVVADYAPAIREGAGFDDSASNGGPPAVASNARLDRPPLPHLRPTRAPVPAEAAAEAHPTTPSQDSALLNIIGWLGRRP